MILTNTGRKIYDGYAVTATTNYVYNNSGGSTSADGWIESNYERVYLEFAVATLTASCIDYRIEGKNSILDRAASITVGQITSADTIDRLITITPTMEYIRVGVKAGNVSTPNNIYGSLILVETK